MVVGVDVFHQVQLGLGGADNQNLVRPCQGLCHAVVVVLVFGQSAVTEGSSRRVQLVVRVVGLDHKLLDTVGAEVDDVGLHMVDPDDSVVTGH